MVGVGVFEVGLEMCVLLKCELKMNCDMGNNIKIEMSLEKNIQQGFCFVLFVIVND